MLTAKEIGKYIDSPDSIQAADLEELKNLTEKYPYTQLFSILYLKGMSASNSVDFETSLKEHSYRISDRSQLYKLIHDHGQKSQEDKAEPEGIVTAEITKEEIVPEVEITAKLEEPIEETVETTESPIVTESFKEDNAVKEENAFEEARDQTDSAKETTIETPVSENSNDLVEKEIVEESEVNSKDESYEPKKQLGANLQFEIQPENYEEENNTPEKPKDGLEETILHHVYANHYQLPELTYEEKQALEKKKREEIEIPEILDEKETTEKELPVDSKQTFTNWLHANSNYTEPSDIEKKAINSIVDDFAAFDPLESLSGEFEKPKKEFFSPSKKAKESLSENKLPVSETLAKIYVMQGNYPKAISAYNELILAFPEKKIFFANQIEDLKKKLNK